VMCALSSSHGIDRLIDRLRDVEPCADDELETKDHNTSGVASDGFANSWWNLPISQMERNLYEDGRATVADVREIVRDIGAKLPPPQAPAHTAVAPDLEAPVARQEATAVPPTGSHRLAFEDAATTHRFYIKGAKQRRDVEEVKRLQLQLAEIEAYLATIVTWSHEMALASKARSKAGKNGAAFAAAQAKIDALNQEADEYTLSLDEQENDE